jgi:hypothetical protein
MHIPFFPQRLDFSSLEKIVDEIWKYATTLFLFLKIKEKQFRKLYTKRLMKIT